MDATFTEEQAILAEVAGQIARRPLDGDAPDDTWDALVGGGLLSLHLPGHLGGGGAGGVEVAIVAEALGRTVAPVPFLGPVLALELLALAGGAGDLVDRDLIDGVASGRRRLTLALDRTLAAAARTGGEGTWVGFDAVGAEGLVGLRQGEAGTEVVVVPGPFTERRSTDLTRTLVEVDPAGQGAVAEAVGGPLAPEALVRWEALAQVALCADMVGTMRGALDLAVEYAGQRQQFGRPIGSFQAIQHLAADQHVSVEAAESATYYAAWAVDELPADQALVAALTAKAYLCPRAREVTEAVLQIHGGMGHTWENRPHYFLRRALLDRVVLGDETAVLARLAVVP